MNARSALFDLYGDHLRVARRCGAPVAALVRLLAPLGVAAPAVRTAVSRMVRQGWLEPVRLPAGRATRSRRRAVRRLDDAAARIYRTQRRRWDGTWHLLVTDAARAQPRATGSRAGLTFLGFAQLDDATWIGPRSSDEVDAPARGRGRPGRALHARPRRRLARPGAAGPGTSRALAAAYTRWLADAQELVGDRPVRGRATSRRSPPASRLVHEWRKFLFLDPGLPRELLPEDWPGDEGGRLLRRRERPAAAGGGPVRRLLPAHGRLGTSRPMTRFAGVSWP